MSNSIFNISGRDWEPNLHCCFPFLANVLDMSEFTNKIKIHKHNLEDTKRSLLSTRCYKEPVKAGKQTRWDWRKLQDKIYVERATSKVEGNAKGGDPFTETVGMQAAATESWLSWPSKSLGVKVPEQRAFIYKSAHLQLQWHFSLHREGWQDSSSFLELWLPCP